LCPGAMQKPLPIMTDTVKKTRRAKSTVAADYERQSRLARALAEEYFDARKPVARLLERAVS
jgi:hypothetical protein